MYAIRSYYGSSVIAGDCGRRRRISLALPCKSWMCLICGFVYDEEKGLPDEGIAPGTRWEDVPMNRNNFV